MQVGLVVGSATCTVRHPSLAGQKILVVQLLQGDATSPDGEPILAVDRLGAGDGDRVIVTSDGRSMRDVLNDKTTPVRWSVLGITDAN